MGSCFIKKAEFWRKREQVVVFCACTASLPAAGKQTGCSGKTRKQRLIQQLRCWCCCEDYRPGRICGLSSSFMDPPKLKAALKILELLCLNPGSHCGDLISPTHFCSVWRSPTLQEFGTCISRKLYPSFIPPSAGISPCPPVPALHSAIPAPAPAPHAAPTARHGMARLPYAGHSFPMLGTASLCWAGGSADAH